jgi:hypothetical protein
VKVSETCRECPDNVDISGKKDVKGTLHRHSIRKKYLKTIMTLQQIEFGDPLFPRSIERIYAEEGKKHKFAILRKKIFRVPLHHDQKIGAIHCSEGKCCEFYKKPKFFAVIPVLEYTDADPLIKNPDQLRFEIKYLQIPKRDYEYLLGIGNEVGDITEFDLYFEYVKTEKQYNFELSDKAIWKTNKKTEESVLKKLKKKLEGLEEAVAKTVSEESIYDLFNNQLSKIKQKKQESIPTNQLPKNENPIKRMLKPGNDEDPIKRMLKPSNNELDSDMNEGIIDSDFDDLSNDQ